MWEISSYSQYICFLYSLVLGVSLGIVYDLFKLDRLLFKRSKIFLFFSDILFWLISAFLIFTFCVIFSNGQIRGYIVLGTLLGFVIYRLTLSKLIFLLVNPLKKLVKKLNNRYYKLIEKANDFISKQFFKAKKIIKVNFFFKKRKNNQIIQKNS